MKKYLDISNREKIYNREKNVFIHREIILKKKKMRKYISGSSILMYSYRARHLDSGAQFNDIDLYMLS